MQSFLGAIFVGVATFSIPVVPSPISDILNRATTLPLPTRLLAQFPDPTWIENIAVRSNGDLLVTVLAPNASVYSISDPSSYSPSVNLVHTFDSVTSMLGISEVRPDVFVVVGGNINGLTQVNGSFSAWKLDLASKGNPLVQLITSMPEANFLNGVEKLPTQPDVVLISDSSLGSVWRLNTRTGQYKVVIHVPEMATTPGAPVQIGINGLHIRDEYLYWSNSFQTTIYRLKIDDSGYPANGAEVEVVVEGDILTVDDFTFDNKGIIWAATNPNNELVAVQPFGEYVVVAGATDQLTLAGLTACAFGRGINDKQTVYVVTNGGIFVPVNGSESDGGSVVAVDTRGFEF